MYEFDALVIIGVLGVLAFLVGLIVEVTKEIPGIVRLPTKLYAIIISVVVCQFALWIFASFVDIAVNWYCVLLAIFMAYVVSAISIFGRDTIKEIYSRFKLRGFYSKFKR